MKLAACFSVFNGLELLNLSVSKIINDVDHVILCVSRANHFGVPNESAWNYVQHFRSNKKITIVSFAPDPAVSSKQNERVKHQLMIDQAGKMGMTHFILMAEDHFYSKSEFRKAKRAVSFFGFDASFTHMYTYYKHPTWRLTPIENYCAPFICAIKKGLKVVYKTDFPVKTDPSVQVDNVGNWHLFEQGTIMLHHMSMIREKIEDKIDNAAAKIRWTDQQMETFKEEWASYDIVSNPGVSYFQMRTITIVPDEFDIQFHAPFLHT